MKINFKKHWQAITAFAVGGAMCLGLGIFVFANHTAQTELKNDSIQETGELLLVSADGSQNNGGTSKGCSLTVSQWSEIGVYGDVNSLIQGLNPGSANDPAGQAIWASIQNAVLYGNATIFTVTLQMSSPAGTYTTPIQVVGNSPISASGNTLTIAGTNFTASPQSGYECCWSGIPVGGTVTSNITITAEFALPWWVSVPGATSGGTYGSGTVYPSGSGTNITYTPFDGYRWVSFGNTDVRWIIIGSGSTAALTLSLTTDKGTQNRSDEIGNSQILLLSEKILTNAYFNKPTSNGSNYASSSPSSTNTTPASSLQQKMAEIYADANGTYGITSTLKSHIQSVNLTNAYYDGSSIKTSISSSQTFFALSTRYGYNNQLNSTSYDSNYGAQQYWVETYLNNGSGTGTGTYEKMEAYLGTSYYTWWLRSGYSDASSKAYGINSSGCVYSYYCDRNYGFRPAFVLNLG